MEDIKCKYCGKSFTKKGLCVNHELYYCKDNPNKKERKKPSKKIIKEGKEGGWTCHCGKNFRTRKELQDHRKKCDTCKVNGICSQIHVKEKRVCPFCNKEWETTIEGLKNHITFCKSNPNRKEQIHRKHTEEEKEHLSKIAKQNNFGGWHTSKTYDYKGIKLDSSYELEFAKSLDKNNIVWKRPKSFTWNKDNKSHRYYPDFFIPSLNVYVDTKNDYLINNVNPRFGITDTEKINIVQEQNNIKIIILDKNNLSYDKLLKIL